MYEGSKCRVQMHVGHYLVCTTVQYMSGPRPAPPGGGGRVPAGTMLCGVVRRSTDNEAMEMSNSSPADGVNYSTSRLTSLRMRGLVSGWRRLRPSQPWLTTHLPVGARAVVMGHVGMARCFYCVRKKSRAIVPETDPWIRKHLPYQANSVVHGRLCCMCAAIAGCTDDALSAPLLAANLQVNLFAVAVELC